MSGEDEDPFGLLHWPEEFLLPGDFGENELFSIILAASGLEDADLRPLAEHLRKGYAVPPKIAKKIADAIEGHGSAPCQIYAKRLKRGRKQTPGTRARDLQIGFAVETRLNCAKASEYESVLADVSEINGVGRTTVFKAHQKFRDWISRFSTAAESEGEE